MTTAPYTFDWLTPEENVPPPRTWGKWHFTRKRFLVYSPNGKPSAAGYEVDLWEINDHKTLVDWLFHVGGKPYGGDAGFYDAMHDILRRAGWDKTFTGKDLATRYWEISKPVSRS